VTLGSWAESTADFLLATLGLYVVVFPGLTVCYALATGAPIFARPPQAAALVVAAGGSYPFVAGNWPFHRLFKFAVGLWVASGAVGLLGLTAVATFDWPLPSAVLARTAVLAVAYPAGATVAFRDRLPVPQRSRPPEFP